MFTIVIFKMCIHYIIQDYIIEHKITLYNTRLNVCISITNNIVINKILKSVSKTIYAQVKRKAIFMLCKLSSF